MDAQTAQVLNALNRRFYQEQAASFSETRQHGWSGWRQLVECVQQQWGSDDARLIGNAPLRVLDMACGNLRFERFLQEMFPLADIRAVGVDSCADLLPETTYGNKLIDSQITESQPFEFVEKDIVISLIEGRSILSNEYKSAFDLVVSFGFFHHIPGEEPRQKLLSALGKCVAPNGIVCVSLWRFMDDVAFASKARVMHENALTRLPDLGFSLSRSQLESGDTLLGWQNKTDAFRYCHSFSDGEVKRLIEIAQKCDLSVSARYRADGATDAMNEYLVFEKQVS